ncbi:hypothetical protein SNEBB_011185 [Seison nebaliae]|nr:hypothetical protein SNEBB_011185 [Seison nebaliae]
MFSCPICSQSVHQGIRTYECKHYFCGKHISDGTLESLPNDLFSCPVCHSPFGLEDLYNCPSQTNFADSGSDDESNGSCDEINSSQIKGIPEKYQNIVCVSEDEEETGFSLKDSSMWSKPCQLEERNETTTVRSNDEYFSPCSIFGGQMFLNGWKRYGYQWTLITKCLKELRCCSILPVDMKNNETHYAFVVSCLQHIHIFKNKFVPIFIFGRNDFIENTKNDENLQVNAPILHRSVELIV